MAVFSPLERVQLASSPVAIGIVGVTMVLTSFAALAACGGDAASDAWRSSAVGVEAFGCGLVPAVGSGIAVAEQDLVMTTAHTVAGSTEIDVVDALETRRPAQLVWLDSDRDVALLAVSDLDADPLPIAEAMVGDDGAFVAWDRRTGFRSSAIEVTERLSVTIEDIYIEHDVARHAIEFRGPIEPGDSGAAIVHDGAVIGMIYARARDASDVGYALADQELRQALAESGRQDRLPIDSGACTP